MRAGVVQRLECDLAKVETRVRFPSLAPFENFVRIFRTLLYREKQSKDCFFAC